MESLLQDLRYALRTLRKSPAFTLIAILTLALGIGANSAIFTVVNGVLLEPLAYDEPDRLVRIWERNLDAGFPRFSVSPPNYVDYRDQASSFEALAARSGSSYHLTGDGEPLRLNGSLVSGNYFEVLSTRPAVGRLLQPEDDQLGGPPVVVISHSLWQSRFGGDPGLIGQDIRLSDEPYTVIGVLPADFPQTFWDVFAPLRLNVEETGRGSHYFSVYGRLKADVSLTQVNTELDTITARLREEYPGSNTGWDAFAQPLQDMMVEDVETGLLMLLGAVGLVLLIACANVASLMLSRLSLREREVALRTALGAGRRRLLRQFLTESALLALAGGALGLLFAGWGTRLLLGIQDGGIPRADNIAVNGDVLVFTLVLSLLTGLLFGLLPALQASRPDLNSALREGSQGAGTGRRNRITRSSLVFAEVALTLVVLIVAGLLLRSLGELLDVSPGFDAEGVLTASLTLPESQYPDEAARARFYQQLFERAEALPGVERAASIMPMPLTGGNFVLIFYVDGRPIPEPNKEPNANIRVVGPDYFETMGIQLDRGRLFNDQDAIGAQRVAIISRAAAETFWPDQDPIGQRITHGDPSNPESSWMTIVGVVGNVRHNSLDAEPGPDIYWPVMQRPMEYATVVLRAESGDPANLAGPLRAAVGELDPNLPLFEVQTLRQIVDASVAQPRFNVVLLTLFAACALLLAAIGVYGLISYSVTQRLREIGIRAALGAERGDLLKIVIRDAMTPVLGGLAIGVAAALIVGWLLRSLVFGISPTDPVTYVTYTGLLLVVAFFASLLPALRATRVDPVVVLRDE